jgi:uncharacterized membrane protein
MDHTLLGLLVIGAIIEAVIQILKLLWNAETRTFSVTWIVLIVVAIGFAILGEHDWIMMVWDGFPPIVNQILTGLLFARVAQFVHDLYKKVM